MESEIEKKSKEDLEQESGPISYLELQRFFAKGMIITVAKSLSLVDVALCLQEDDAKQLQKWMDDGLVVRAHDDHAKKWYENKSQLTAVTMTPWVLVQE